MVCGNALVRHLVHEASVLPRLSGITAQQHLPDRFPVRAERDSAEELALCHGCTPEGGELKQLEWRIVDSAYPRQGAPARTAGKSGH